LYQTFVLSIYRSIFRLEQTATFETEVNKISNILE